LLLELIVMRKKQIFLTDRALLRRIK